MKLMTPYASGGKEAVRPLNFDLDVSQRGEPRQHVHDRRIDTDHGEELTLVIADACGQIHKSATLRVHYPTLLDKGFHLLAHSGVCRQPLSVHFGIAATEVEPVQVGREVGVV